MTIEKYMAIHQNEPSAIQLWNYFRSVIDWVEAIFPKKRKEMKGVEWGLLFNKHGERTDLDPKALEARIQELLADEDVTKKSGIYEYLLTDDERKLNIRAFTDKQKQEQYQKQNGICVKCGKHFEYNEMEGDHIIAWSQGGKTVPENLQMLCKRCNNTKSNA